MVVIEKEEKAFCLFCLAVGIFGWCPFVEEKRGQHLFKF